ncbi:MAG: hypothetical protein NDJ24_01040 [Alphaproteobacteria bacterium]|nr:hypothetical protein [Alphaproteobacteria bacterium]
MSDDDTFYIELDRLGEKAVRERLAKRVYGEKKILLVQHWLSEQASNRQEHKDQQVAARESEAIRLSKQANAISISAVVISAIAILCTFILAYQQNKISRDTYELTATPVITMEYSGSDKIFYIFNKGSAPVTIWGHRVHDNPPKQHSKSGLIPVGTNQYMSLSELENEINLAHLAITKSSYNDSLIIPIEVYVTDIKERQYTAKASIYVRSTDRETIDLGITAEGVIAGGWPKDISQKPPGNPEKIFLKVNKNEIQ